MVGCAPQSGQSGSRRMRISRLNIARAHLLVLPHVEQDHLVTLCAACRHGFDADLRDGPASRVEEIVGGVWHMLLLSCVLLPEPRSARARGRTSRQCSQTLETPTVSGAIPGSPDSRGRRDAETGGVMLHGARGAAHTCCGIFRPALWSRPASAGPSTTDDTRRRRRRAAAGPSRVWDRSRHTHTIVVSL